MTFEEWWSQALSRHDIPIDPNDANHFYDYKAYWEEYGKMPGPGEHGDSRFKIIQIKKAYPFISIYGPQKKSNLILEFKNNIKLNIGDKINLKIFD